MSMAERVNEAMKRPSVHRTNGTGCPKCAEALIKEIIERGQNAASPKTFEAVTGKPAKVPEKAPEIEQSSDSAKTIEKKIDKLQAKYDAGKCSESYYTAKNEALMDQLLELE